MEIKKAAYRILMLITTPKQVEKTMEIFGHEETEQDTKEAAKEAITEDMTLAMMRYMPLHALKNFSGYI